MSRPYLASAFFEEVPPNPQFWQKWQSFANWNENLVPLYEWEGTLFVGLTPDSPAPEISGQVVFVEAHGEALSGYYSVFKALSKPLRIPEKKIEVTGDGVLADPFAMLSNDTPVAVSIANDPEFLLQDEPSVEIAAEAPIADEAPGGMDILELGLDFDATPSPHDLPEQPAAQEQFAEQHQVAATPIRQNAHDQAEWISEKETAQAFEQMKTHYLKSMLLRKEGNAFVPWKWDQQFLPSQTNISPITLGVPSPFRIVSRTQRPYHGYVVSGEVQERFFDEWNQSQIPDHVTICPILENNEICGVLLAVATQGVNPKASLLLAEKVALRISSELTNNLLAS